MGTQSHIAVELLNKDARLDDLRGSLRVLAISQLVDDGEPLPITRGSKEAERLIGQRRDDHILGLSGDDTLIGRAGDDRLFGNAGDDRLIGGSGSDVLRGGAGEDSLSGGRGSDTLIAGSGSDSLNGGGGSDVVRGGGGSDTLVGRGGSDTLRGGGGTDLLNGGRGDDVVSGGGGDDIAKGSFGDDTLRGGRGDDTLLGGRGNDQFFGGAGKDTFVFIADDLDGGESDFLDAFESEDQFDFQGFGPDGITLNVVETTSAQILLKLIDGSESSIIIGSIDEISAKNLEVDIEIANFDESLGAISIRNSKVLRTVGLLNSNDLNNVGLHITGTSELDALIGRFGNDTIDGLAGNDQIFTSNGADELFGGFGSDSFVILEFLPLGSPINTVMDFEPGDEISARGALSKSRYWSIHDRLQLLPDGEDLVLYSRLNEAEPWIPALRLKDLAKNLPAEADLRTTLEILVDAPLIQRTTERNPFFNLGVAPLPGSGVPDLPDVGPERTVRDLLYLEAGEHKFFNVDRLGEVILLTPDEQVLRALGTPARGIDPLENAVLEVFAKNQIGLNFRLLATTTDGSVDLSTLQPLGDNEVFRVSISSEDTQQSGLFFVDLI